jgi:SAM-dependent methyltransferase
MSDDVRDDAQDLYADAAAEYAASQGRAHGDDMPLLLEWLEPKRAWSVLEVATSDGRTAAAISPHVRSVIATDADPEAVHAAQRYVDGAGCANVTCELADAHTLPYDDLSFDAVVCRIGPHHFSEPRRFLGETSRVLKPGGRFLLVDDVAPDDAPGATLMNGFERLRDPRHVRALSVPEWTHLLGESGLQLVHGLRARTCHDFPQWAAKASFEDGRVELLERAIMEMPRPARAYFAVCTAGPRVLSLEVDRWKALAVRPA